MGFAVPRPVNPNPERDPMPAELRYVIELVTQLAAMNDRKYIREELIVALEDRLRALQRMREES